MGSRRAQQCLRPDYARSEPGQRTALPQVRPAARRDENDGQRRQVLSSGVCEAVVNLPMSFASFCEETKREEAVRKDSGTLASNLDAAPSHSMRSSSQRRKNGVDKISRRQKRVLPE